MPQGWYIALGTSLIDTAIIAIAAVGFTLQFGVTNYVNFAYGEFLTFGAFAGYIFNSAVFHLNVWVALVVAGCVTAVFALGIGRFVYGPFFRRRPQLLYALVLTFAMSLILSNVYLAIWGTQYRQLDYPLAAIFHFGPFFFTSDELMFVLIAAMCLLAVHVMLRYTRLGRSMRAMSDDQSLATVCGLNVQRITDMTWLITGFLAGAAGVIQAIQTHSFDATLGDAFIYVIFTAAVFGGIGRPYGALVGAAIVSLAENFSVFIVGSALSPTLVFALLVVVMLFRPNGLLGSTGRSSFQNA